MTADEVEQVLAHVLPIKLIGRLPKMLGEVRHGADVQLLGALGRVAHAHVVEHALTEGGHG
jgi:hypothetical protein